MRGPKLGLRTFLLITLSVMLMFFDHRTTYFVKTRSFLSTVASPLQYVVDWPIEIVDWVSTSFATHSKLLQENASLRVQQVLLNAQLQKLILIEKENNQLRALLESTPKVNQDKILVSQVLAVDSAPFMHQVVLDRGNSSGVFVGQPAVDASGVMGQIVSVSKYTSRVMLLDDPRSSIPAEDSRNNIRGIVIGGGIYDSLYLTHIASTTDIKVGDELVSSGLGLRYPIGYPIGVVTKIIHRPNQPFMDIMVKASALLLRSRLVLLVWPSAQKVVVSARKELHNMQQQSMNRQKMYQQGIT